MPDPEPIDEERVEDVPIGFGHDRESVAIIAEQPNCAQDRVDDPHGKQPGESGIEAGASGFAETAQEWLSGC